ncbi:30S ribosomal protein S6 [Candidatus Saccharibacteria bacterium]|nr:30S ribosomal protein S6 [Candidatus Saccharibacteria bacterium]
MQKYEVAILYDPGLEVDLSKAEDRVKKIFDDNKAKIISSDNWGKKKLAYPIAKNEHAVYVFYIVEIPTENVGKIENTLNITDEVIRYLIVRQDEKELAKAKEAKEAKEKADKERAQKEDDTSQEPKANEDDDEANE